MGTFRRNRLKYFVPRTFYIFGLYICFVLSPPSSPSLPPTQKTPQQFQFCHTEIYLLTFLYGRCFVLVIYSCENMLLINRLFNYRRWWFELSLHTLQNVNWICKYGPNCMDETSKIAKQIKLTPVNSNF